jgi:hypothetical protein
MIDMRVRGRSFSAARVGLTLLLAITGTWFVVACTQDPAVGEPEIVLEDHDRFPNGKVISTAHTVEGDVVVGGAAEHFVLTWSIVESADGCHRIDDVIVRRTRPSASVVLSNAAMSYLENEPPCVLDLDPPDDGPRFEQGSFRANLENSGSAYRGNLAALDGRGRGQWLAR